MLPVFLHSFSVKCVWILNGRLPLAYFPLPSFLFLKNYQLLRPGSSGNLHYNPSLQGMFPWFTGASKEKERGQRLYPNRDSLPAALLGTSEVPKGAVYGGSPRLRETTQCSLLIHSREYYTTTEMRRKKQVPLHRKLFLRQCQLLAFPEGLKSTGRDETRSERTCKQTLPRLFISRLR